MGGETKDRTRKGLMTIFKYDTSPRVVRIHISCLPDDDAEGAAAGAISTKTPRQNRDAAVKLNRNALDKLGNKSKDKNKGGGG